MFLVLARRCASSWRDPTNEDDLHYSLLLNTLRLSTEEVNARGVTQLTSDIVEIFIYFKFLPGLQCVSRSRLPDECLGEITLCVSLICVSQSLSFSLYLPATTLRVGAQELHTVLEFRGIHYLYT